MFPKCLRIQDKESFSTGSQLHIQSGCPVNYPRANANWNAFLGPVLITSKMYLHRVFLKPGFISKAGNSNLLHVVQKLKWNSQPGFQELGCTASSLLPPPAPASCCFSAESSNQILELMWPEYHWPQVSPLWGQGTTLDLRWKYSESVMATLDKFLLIANDRNQPWLAELEKKNGGRGVQGNEQIFFFFLVTTGIPSLNLKADWTPRDSKESAPWSRQR